MAVGHTNTGSLADSLPTTIDSARIIRDHEVVFPALTTRITMPENQGLTFDEVSLAALTAQSITETTILDNPQQIQDTLFQIEPQQSAVQTLVTDKVRRRISANVAAQMGVLAGNAMDLKKEKDGLAILDGATTSLGAAGSPLASSSISAAVSRIRGNSTEPGKGPIYTVLHPNQIYDIQTEIVTGVGTYNIPEGLTEEVFRKGFSGSLFSSEVYASGNITVDASDDAKGGVFAKEAIILVQGYAPHGETMRRPDIGGGADVMYLFDEYAYGERSAGNWLFEVYTDAANPS